LQPRLAALGLHLGQELLIVDLAVHPGSTQAEVVERLEVEQPTVAKMLARLERSGFIRRSPDSHDRRRTRVHVTRTGRAAVTQIVSAWGDADAAVTANFTERELATMVRLLQKLALKASGQRTA
jgi:DNA-binding MarR family transcriptional regulator